VCAHVIEGVVQAREQIALDSDLIGLAFGDGHTARIPRSAAAPSGLAHAHADLMAGIPRVHRHSAEPAAARSGRPIATPPSCGV